VDLTALDAGGSWRVLREGAVSPAKIAVGLGEPPA
jgi:hypothetical protein